MSIKGKIVATITTKTAEKIFSTEKINDGINKLLNKAYSATDTETTEKCIKSIKKNHYFIIQSRSYSLGNIIRATSGKKPTNIETPNTTYKIYNNIGELSYKTTENEDLLLRNITEITDANDQKIGHIKELLNNIGIPLFEKNVRKCQIFYNTDQLCEIKKYESFGEKEIETSTSKISFSKIDDEKVEIVYNKKRIAIIHSLPAYLKDGYTDKFIVEYDEPQHEHLCLLLTIGYDIVDF